MHTRVLAVGGLTAEQVRSILVAATIELYADSARAAFVADPDQRELLLSCGAALLHLHTCRSCAAW